MQSSLFCWATIGGGDLEGTSLDMVLESGGELTEGIFKKLT